MKFLHTCILCFVMVFSMGQTKTLSLDNTFELIRRFHPVLRQASLQVDIADANLQSSRGFFDPSFYMDNSRKTFDGKNYFQYANSELKIPTWFGIDIKAGIENNLGDRTNPAFSPGKNTYAGVSLPILKGLLFDSRRAAVQQAKMFTKMSRQEQLLSINDLMYNAAETYWAWVSAYQVLQVLNEAVVTNQKRFEYVRQSFQLGDRAAIDTTEALTQLQLVQSMQQQSWIDFQKQRLMLSNFLWTQSETPYELSDQVIPDSSWLLVSVKQYPLPVLNDVLQTTSLLHPKLLTLDSKMDILGIERKEKFQKLLPQLDLQYNFLNQGYVAPKIFSQPLFENNFKYGLQFGLPLFLRDARGDYSKTKLKITDLNYQIKQIRLELENKVKASFNEVLALQQQVDLFQSNVNNQRTLLRVEETKFSIGESSMFLVNAREVKLLETQQKLFELKTKFFKSILSVQWASGQIR